MNPVDKLDCADCHGGGNLRDLTFPKIEKTTGGNQFRGVGHIWDMPFIRHRCTPGTRQISIEI